MGLKTSILRIIFGTIFLVVGLFAFIGSWRAHEYDLAIQKRGGQTIGHITEKYFSQPNDWTINYWFLLPDGQTFTVRHRGVSESLWGKLQPGDEIDVRYEIDNPNRNFPVNEGNTPRGVTIYASIIALLFAGFGTLLLTYNFKFWPFKT